jgi:hypothetical protein
VKDRLYAFVQSSGYTRTNPHGIQFVPPLPNRQTQKLAEPFAPLRHKFFPSIYRVKMRVYVRQGFGGGHFLGISDRFCCNRRSPYEAARPVICFRLIEIVEPPRFNSCFRTTCGPNIRGMRSSVTYFQKCISIPSDGPAFRSINAQ